MFLPELDTRMLVYNRVIKFMTDNDIHCVETIYQTDYVIEDAYSLLKDLFHLVRHQIPDKDEEE